MLHLALIGLWLALLVSPLGGVVDAGSPPCQFRWGFAALHTALPSVVGACLDDERAVSAAGDAIQHTSHGLLVWRAAEGVAAFTDGRRTWETTPYGLLERPNDQRFAWEANPGRLPIYRRTARDGDPGVVAPGALLPAHRIVAFYGNPRYPGLGALGEGAPAAMLDRLQAQAAAYAAADPTTPVLPALELIASVADPTPGADGAYRTRATPDLIARVAGWAASRDDLLILDVQPGRAAVAEEVQALLPFLARPDVDLALDPEFAMAPDQVPGQVYGRLDAATVNGVIATLGALVTQDKLPPKVLIIHRFREDMLTNAADIVLDPRVQVVIDMDGFGSPAAKRSSYDAYVRAERVQFTGAKLFYNLDAPLWTPRDVLSLDPRPSVVIYQ